MSLLDREGEEEAARMAMEAAVGGRGRLLLFDGPSGSGRTSMVDAVVTEASDRGFRVLQARGSDLERGFCFGIALQLFEREVAAADPVRRVGLLSGAASLASPLFPFSDGPDVALSVEERGFSVIHGLFWLAANLADETPLLLAVDDAHFADRASLRFLAYLADRLDDLRILVVMASRADDVAGADDPLVPLRCHRHARVFELGPLQEASVCGMVRRSLPDASDRFCATLAELTGGNPGLLDAYLAAVALEAMPTDDAGVDQLRALTPPSLSRLFLARTRGFEATAVTVLRAAAVLGEGVDAATVAAVAGLDDTTTRARLAELAAVDLLCPGEPVRFAHHLVATVVTADIPIPLRHDLHGRAARLLARRGAAPDLVAAHLLHTEPDGDEWVVATLWAAGHRAMIAGIAATAARLLERAAREPAPDDIQGDLLADLGTAEAAAALPTALDRLTHAAEMIGSRTQRAAVLHRAGTTLRAWGRFDDAAEAFDLALAQHPEDPRLRLALEAAYSSVARMDRSLRVAARDRVDDLLRAAQETGALNRIALAETSFEKLLRNDPRREVVDLARTAVGGRAVLDEHGAGEPAIYTAAGALTWSDDFETAEGLLEPAIAQARRQGLLMAVASGTHRRAVLNHYLGLIPQAVADAEEAVAADRHGWQAHLAGARAALALALVETGETHRAALVVDGPEVERRFSSSTLWALVMHARGRVRLALGDPSGAFDDFTSTGRLADQLSIVNPSVLPWRSDAAIAAAELGDGDESQRLAREEIELADAFGAPRARARARWGLAVAEGRAASMPTLHEALELLEDVPEARLLGTEVRLELGAALRVAGRRTDAVRCLREAGQRAIRCGSARLAGLARDELAACGARPSRRGGEVKGRASEHRELTAPAALTPSEWRVADLACRGLSNREIAQQLFVTVKAVEGHLRTTYGKLGIASRHELAPALADARGDAAAVS